jgi:crossover junction endodeoxyribonuclease RuvC
MVILGIDPGYAIIGYGAIEYHCGKFTPIEYGSVTTQGEDFSQRLLTIHCAMVEILHKLKPDTVSIEKLFFHSNQKTVIKVAQARGVLLLAAKECNTPICEYTPLQVKSSVTGYGKAEKKQVMEMTRMLLHLKEVPKPDDTADALAVAICHAQCGGSAIKQLIIRGRKNVL